MLGRKIIVEIVRKEGKQKCLSFGVGSEEKIGKSTVRLKCIYMELWVD